MTSAADRITGEEIPGTTDGAFGTMTAPVWTEAGFIVNVATPDEGGIYLTTDGSSWEQVAAIPLPDVPARIRDGRTTLGFRLPFSEGEVTTITDGSEVFVSTDGRSWLEPAPVLDSGFVQSGAFAPDGRLFLVGADISDCRESFCVFAPGNGAMPAMWVGEPG